MAMHLTLTGTTTIKGKTQHPESNFFFFHLLAQLYQIASTEVSMASKSLPNFLT